MAIQFKPESAWRGRGAPRVQIPPAVREALERSYRDHAICEERAEEGAEETEDFVRLARLYAARRGLSFRHQFFDGPDGETYIRFRMCDKRTYRRPTAPRERR